MIFSLHFLNQLEYYKRGFVDDFKKILEHSKLHASSDYADYECDQLQVFDLLACYYVQLAKKESDRNHKNELFAQADQLFNAADKIIMYDQVSVRIFLVLTLEL